MPHRRLAPRRLRAAGSRQPRNRRRRPGRLNRRRQFRRSLRRPLRRPPRRPLRLLLRPFDHRPPPVRFRRRPANRASGQRHEAGGVSPSPQSCCSALRRVPISGGREERPRPGPRRPFRPEKPAARPHARGRPALRPSCPLRPRWLEPPPAAVLPPFHPPYRTRRGRHGLMRRRPLRWPPVRGPRFPGRPTRPGELRLGRDRRSLAAGQSSQSCLPPSARSSGSPMRDRLTRGRRLSLLRGPAPS